ncbi:MAG: allantoinase AllB [Bacillota bacterium]
MSTQRRGSDILRGDLLIRGGTVVTGEGSRSVDLVISNERIVAWTAPGEVGDDEVKRVMDVSGMYVLPGIVDPHVHFNEPGKDEREDFATGSAAAASGGVTTVVEMPNSIPPCNSAQMLKRRVELADEKMMVDFAFYGAAGWDNLEDIADLAEGGVIGYKTFLTQPPPERAAEFEGLSAEGPAQIWDVFRAISETGLVSAVHAESGRMLRKFQRELQENGRTDFMAFAESRPEIVELEATVSVLELARASGCRVQLCHVSSPRAVELASLYREEGVPVTVETCPHYLTFDEEALRELGPQAKIAPPLRSAAHVQGMWDLLLSGDIDILGSDHAPYLASEKEAGAKDIFRAASGVAGIELLLPLMLTHASEGRLSLEDLTILMAENPARIFGLHPKKGSLNPGCDADLVVVDMEAEWEVDSQKLLTRGKAAARLFDGMRLRGKPVTTIVRGRPVMEKGEVVGSGEWGQYQRPDLI